jgi:DNA-binding FrmR family transcriptional regulator
MKLENPEVKHNLSGRLRRIEGQIRGIEAMIDGERDCQEVLQQLAAVRAALRGLTMTFMEGYARDCLLGLETERDMVQREQMVKDLMALLAKAD